jgi:hypothetical protein
MVRIQIDTGYLVVKEGSDFPLTFEIGDIRDISKRKGNKSKSIILADADINHELLSHKYDVNIIDGTFDINQLTPCTVIQNDVVIMDDAYLQLVEVIKDQKSSEHEQSVEYRVLIKSSSSNFFSAINNKLLTDLNLSEFDHVYNSTNVVNSFTNSVTDGYKYLLPYHTNNVYNLSMCHPAVYAKVYFDRIFAAAGFTYEWSDLAANKFDKLIIPYNGEQPKINKDDFKVQANRGLHTIIDTVLPTGQLGMSYQTFNNWTETLDDNNDFNPVTGEYTAPFFAVPGNGYQYSVTIDAEVQFNNLSGASAYLWMNNPSFNPELLLILRLNNVTQGVPVAIIYQNVGSNVGGQTIPIGLTTQATINQTVTGMHPITNQNDVLELEVTIVPANGNAAWRDAATQTVPAYVRTELKVNSIDLTIVPNSDLLGFGQTLQMDDYIPKKVKQSDFIKSIFNMYNLYTEIDPAEPNKLILLTRDDYYDTGANKDWTKKLHKGKQQLLKFLPELTKKKMLLTYKQDKDDPNVYYEELTNEVYGQLEYTFENEYIKDVDKKELVFSPTPIGTTSFNAVVPYLSGTPKTNIRILYDGATQTCDPFDIVDYWTNTTPTGTTSITTAPTLTHFDDPINPTFDINFGVCDFYLYDEWNSKTNNNLFNNYWRRTLNQIDSGLMMTAYFNLNEYDIQTLKLNDRIRIDNSWWFINKVADYNATKTPITKVELISIDEELGLKKGFAQTSTVPTKPTKPDRPVRPVKPTRFELSEVVKRIVEDNQRMFVSLQPDQTNVKVYGINNIVGGNVKNAVIVGDNNNVTEDGVYAPIVEADVQVNLPDGTVWTPEGLQGSPYNEIDAGTDEVLNPFSQSVANFIDAGTDVVLPIGSVVSVNQIDAGEDEV